MCFPILSYLSGYPVFHKLIPILCKTHRETVFSLYRKKVSCIYSPLPSGCPTIPMRLKRVIVTCMNSNSRMFSTIHDTYADFPRYLHFSSSNTPGMLSPRSAFHLENEAGDKSRETYNSRSLRTILLSAVCCDNYQLTSDTSVLLLKRDPPEP